MTSEGWGQGCGENCFTLDGDGFTCHRVLDEPEVWRVELLMHDTFLRKGDMRLTDWAEYVK